MEDKFFTIALCMDAEDVPFNVILPEDGSAKIGDLISFKTPDGMTDPLDVVRIIRTKQDSDEFRYIYLLADTISADQVLTIFSKREFNTDSEKGCTDEEY